ncbi:hypothetical protein BSLG_003116 [Batrachochytrium salamandrivorans]|nr:hypothetical protein BSLG_003116 [Batrachochytrium salamandrivorans]
MSFVPPHFSDIGKPVNELLGKDYPVGSTKLEVKTTTPNGITRGLSFTETWTTSNVLGAEIELEDSLAKGLKLSLHGSLLPRRGTKHARPTLSTNRTTSLPVPALISSRAPSATDAVVGNNGFFAGGEVAYDVSDAKVNKYSASLGYIAPLYSVNLLAANKLSLFSASYCHRVNKEVEAEAKLWNKATDSSVAIEGGYKVRT